MICVACGNKVPVAYNSCPNCGSAFSDRSVSSVISVSTSERYKELKKRSFIPAPYDEDVVPSKTKMFSENLNFDLGFHYMLTRFIVWFFTVVNFVLGVVFFNGEITYVEDINTYVRFSYIGGIDTLTRIYGIAEAQQIGLTACIKLFGAGLMIASLVLIMALIPLVNRKLDAPQGLSSAFEFMIVAKILAGIVASVFTSSPLFLCFTLLLSVPDIAILIISTEYYKTRMHMFG
ncbi:MAG: hypothetical protein MJ172_11905 [Clostridia bacterium]|nr:hypothetical protein [Clostridia bacterium]